jgi:23S rRNA-/tRNA-specific pseudouridylate synthase
MNLPELFYQNQDYLVVGKPSGWLSVPAREPKPDDAVMSHYLRTYSDDLRVVHRLDRFTSGVMIFAKSESAQKEASKWFEKRIVKKVYHFLATPAPTRPAVQVKTPVDGKTALTLFEIVEKGALAFYGKATPLTGRFHQIREHAEVGGFPILGDKTYHGKMELKIPVRDQSELLSGDTSATSGRTEKLIVPRVCLHAARLELPFGVFEMPMPEDMAAVWSRLKNV